VNMSSTGALASRLDEGLAGRLSKLRSIIITICVIVPYHIMGGGAERTERKNSNGLEMHVHYRAGGSTKGFSLESDAGGWARWDGSVAFLCPLMKPRDAVTPRQCLWPDELPTNRICHTMQRARWPSTLG
jgi:hypothetical protein